MIKKLDHIGIAVEDLNKALKIYKEALNLPLEKEEDLPTEGVKVVFLRSDDIYIELLIPIDPNGSVAKFINKRGGGIHHICFEVENIEESLEILKIMGIKLVRDSISKGADGSKVLFLHPSGTDGVLIELKEKGE